MAKLIIDATTGTILNVENCFLVDTNDLTPEQNEILENASDSEISEIAQQGSSILVNFGSDTGWGDNKYRYTVSFSPLSLREEAHSLADNWDDKNSKEFKAFEWASKHATNEELSAIGEFILNDDSVWEAYQDYVIDGLVHGHNESTKEGN